MMILPLTTAGLNVTDLSSSRNDHEKVIAGPGDRVPWPPEACLPSALHRQAVGLFAGIHAGFDGVPDFGGEVGIVEAVDFLDASG